MTTLQETDAPERLLFRDKLVHGLIRLLIASLFRLGRFFRWVRKRRPIDEENGIEVLLTGTFYSDSWINAFVRPLAEAQKCKNVALVTTLPIEESRGVELICPPRLLRRAVGDVLARLLVFAWEALWRRPGLVGGFYISPNGLFAELVASIAGANSMYVCVGGPLEIIDGGLRGESRIFDHLAQADPYIEKQLIRSVRDFDVIVPMGSSAVHWFEDKGVDSEKIKKMTGAIDASCCSPPVAGRPVDIVFVGRLAPIKDLKLLLQTVRVIADSGRDTCVRIVGRGPQESELKQFASDLDLGQFVEFAGFVPDVFDEFKQSKCFVLTSKTEGVSLAMIEAMLGGAVPVVADVGDLGDVIRDGENGFLVNSRDPRDFASSINELLADDRRLSECSKAAYNTGLKYDIHSIAKDWNELIGDIAR